jgi:very-short-patch-repair endonuclease
MQKGSHLRPEIRMKISKSVSLSLVGNKRALGKRWASQEARERVSERMMGNVHAKGKLRSDEQNVKQSARMKAEYQNSEKLRAHIREMRKKAPSKLGIKMSSERLARFRAEMKAQGRYIGAGKQPRGPHTEEWKRKMAIISGSQKRPRSAQILKELWADPAYREKIRQMNLGNTRTLGMHWVNSPEVRARQRVGAARRWANPEIAHRTLSGLSHPTLPEVKVADVLWQDFLIPGKFEYNGQVDAGITLQGCIPDFVWKERKLVIEVHGGHYHTRFQQFEKRRAMKLKLYQDAGYRILELWDDELLDDFNPDVVSAKIHGFINWGR